MSHNPRHVLFALRSLGYSVRVEGGKLWVSPADQLRDVDRAEIAENRDGIIEVLEQEEWEAADSPFSAKRAKDAQL